ncbi:HD domain-containing phosphohydrolase [Fusibacter bizertensis]
MNLNESKILIVDDQEPNTKLLKRILQSFNYNNVDILLEPRDVLGYCQNSAPDLILLDLKMPFMDGFEVMEGIKSIVDPLFIQVIMISAQDEHSNKLRALDLGIVDFISKPFDNIEVILRINKALELKSLHEELKAKNNALQSEVNIKSQLLEDMQMELIDRLMLSAEFRDTRTGYHIARIGHFAKHLAELAGLNERECEIVFHASKLHDIGKIGISDEILLKSNKLTDDEMNIMKLHTIKGAKILSGSKSEILKCAEKIAHNHHEHWDGSGYPDGISGENIDLESRITSVCDVFDALYSSRPYKPAWDLEAVLRELNAIKGHSLDPRLTDLFVEHIEDFLAIKKQIEVE